VFNVTQCENLGLDTPEPVAKPVDAPSVADEVAARVGAVVSGGSDRAAYSPGLDRIVMPALSAFTDTAAYDATLLHELTHWTGHKSRLDRDFSKSKRFGDDAYAFEELVAEIGSAFACARLGVDGQLQHASYLASWIKVLRADKYAIFSAAREAEKACDLLVPASAEVPDAGETDGDVAMAA
jgi:antirestriction protein ArdC